MIIKISVKKLFNMEQMYLNRIESNKRRYRREVRGWEHENQRLKDNLTMQKAEIFSLKEDLKEANDKCKALDEQCEALKLEVEDLKKLFEEKVHSHLQQLAEINELKKDRNDWEDAARSAADNL